MLASPRALRRLMFGALAGLSVTLTILGLVGTTVQPGTQRVPTASQSPVADLPAYNYDEPAALPTTWTDAHNGAFVAYDDFAQRSGVAATFSGRRLAAEGGVYSLRNAAGEVVRTGRTNNLARRAAEHARDEDLGRYRFQVEHRTNDYATQRGLEQRLHEQYSPPLNKINPISGSNPRRGDYLGAGDRFLGSP